ncbi:MAG: LysR family transcriptional regulator [Halieaceae bacterium]|nr:LysR family transcriptional regulator [Halieaceae bacterium]
MDRFAQARVFVELVKAGSLTRAAERLEVANSAVSRRLKELEERLGTQLLRRTTRTMQLTEAGQQYYRRCTQILDDLEEAEAEAMESFGELSGRLSVAAPLSFGVAHISPAINEFMHRHPRLQLDLDLSDRRVDLIREGVDVAIRVGDLSDSSLRARRIAPVNHVVCASPDYLRHNGRPTTPDDLTGHACLCYSNLKSPDIWSYRGRGEKSWSSVRVAPRLRASNGDALAHAAIAGLGVLCEPSFIVHRALRKGLLEPLLTDYDWYEMGIYAVYPQARYLSAKTRMFIDFLADRFGEEPEWQQGIGG